MVNLEAVTAPTAPRIPVHPRETLATDHISEPPDGGVSLPGDPGSTLSSANVCPISHPVRSALMSNTQLLPSGDVPFRGDRWVNY